VTALPPGNRKTAVFAAVTQPLEEYERSEAKRTAGEIAQAKTACKIKESYLKRIQEQGVSAKGIKREDLMREAGELAAELAETTPAAPTRCIADDCTAEKLAGLLRDQGGRIAVMSAEGDVFDIMAGRYSAKTMSNFGVYLKGHAGDPLRVDRVGRPPEFVSQPAITMGLAVQPDVIRGLALKPEFRGRGLLARFLYAIPTSLLGRRDLNASPTPEAVLSDYRDKVLRLLNLPFDKDQNGDPCPHTLTLEIAARGRLQQLEAWLEPQLSEFGELGRMQDWAGKLVGAVARIAGLLHMAELVGTNEPWEMPISEATVEHAIGLGTYFIPHAKAAFAEMGADEIVEKAKVVLRWIAHQCLDSFTKRDVHQGTRGTFKRAAEVDAPISVLVERGFIRRRKEASTGASGRPSSPTFEVNPKWVRPAPERGTAGNSEYCEDSEEPQPPSAGR
jgi:replicative DNA helicase